MQVEMQSTGFSRYISWDYRCSERAGLHRTAVRCFVLPAVSSHLRVRNQTNVLHFVSGYVRFILLGVRIAAGAQILTVWEMQSPWKNEYRYTEIVPSLICSQIHIGAFRCTHAHRCTDIHRCREAQRSTNFRSMRSTWRHKARTWTTNFRRWTANFRRWTANFRTRDH